MRTHRIIFYSTLVLSIAFAPIIYFFPLSSDIKNIFIGIMCSSIVSLIVELPSLLNYKFGAKNRIYWSLLYSKLFLLQYNFKIKEILKENVFNYPNLPSFYLQNIYTNFISYNNTDNTIFYFFQKKSKYFLESKVTLNNYFNKLNNQAIELEIIRNRILLGECSIEDIHNHLKEIELFNNKFIKELNDISNNILSKNKLNQYKQDSKKIEDKLKEVEK